MCSSSAVVLVRYWLQLEFNCGAPAMLAVWPLANAQGERERVCAINRVFIQLAGNAHSFQ
jgi:hypothetical protein